MNRTQKIILLVFMLSDEPTEPDVFAREIRSGRKGSVEVYATQMLLQLLVAILIVGAGLLLTKEKKTLPER